MDRKVPLALALALLLLGLQGTLSYEDNFFTSRPDVTYQPRTPGMPRRAVAHPPAPPPPPPSSPRHGETGTNTLLIAVVALLSVLVLLVIGAFIWYCWIRYTRRRGRNRGDIELVPSPPRRDQQAETTATPSRGLPPSTSPRVAAAAGGQLARIRTSVEVPPAPSVPANSPTLSELEAVARVCLARIQSSDGNRGAVGPLDYY